MRGMAKKGNVGAKFAGALISIVLGLALLPTVRTFVNDSKDGGSNDGLLNLIPTFWIIATMGVAVALGISAFKEGRN